MNIQDVLIRIGYFRDKANLSARELSNRIDKANNYTTLIENNKINLFVYILLDMLEVLGITPEEFFAENYQTYQNDKELLQLIKSLPADKKEHLIKFIKNK